MTLTPSTLRQDLKCGKGAISQGERCTKGPATSVKPSQKEKSRKAQQTINTIGNVATIAAIAGLTAGAIKVSRYSNRLSYQEGVREGRRRHWLSSLERQQTQAASSRSQAIGSIPRQTWWDPPTPPKASPASYVPKTVEERKVGAAWTAAPPKPVNPSMFKERSVSAAFVRVKPKQRKRQRTSDPDVSAAWSTNSVWAAGYNP